MMADGLVDCIADHVAADASGFKVAPRHGVLLCLGISVLIAPAQRLADQQRHQPDNAAGRIGETDIEKLVGRIDGVRRWGIEALKYVEDARIIFLLFLMNGHERRGYKLASWAPSRAAAETFWQCHRACSRRTKLSVKLRVQPISRASRSTYPTTSRSRETPV